MWRREIVDAAKFIRRRSLESSGLVVVLAISIACVMSAATIADRVIFTPLPIPHANRVVIGARAVRPAADAALVSAPEDPSAPWQERAAGIEDAELMAAGPLGAGVTVGRSVRVEARYISGTFGQFLGLDAGRGRWFASADFHSNREPVVILSTRLWRKVVQSDVAHGIRNTITINNVIHEIIGVAPPQLERVPLFASVDIYLPYNANSVAADANILASPLLLARLRPNVTKSAVSRELQHIIDTQPDILPVGAVARSQLLSATELVPARDRSRTLLYCLISLAVLVAALANVAGFLIARCASRTRELATRVALGADVVHIHRLLVLDVLLLTLLAITVGSVMATLLMRAAQNVSMDELQFLRYGNPALVSVPAAMAAIVVFVIACAFAAFAARVAIPRQLLRAPGGSHELRVTATRVQRFTVGAQVFVATALIVVCAPVAAALLQLEQYDHGFEAIDLQFVRVSVPPAGEDRVAALAHEVSIAGDIAMASAVPFRYTEMAAKLRLQGETVDGRALVLASSSVTVNYFDVAGIRVLYSATDKPMAGSTVFIGASLANHLGVQPNEERLLQLTPGGQWLAIGGIVSDVSATGVGKQNNMLQLYTVLDPTRASDGPLWLLSRTRKMGTLFPLVERHGLQPDSYSAEALVAAAVEEYRARTLSITALTVFSWVLTATGLVALVGILIKQQSKDIALRIALGGGLMSAVLALGRQVVPVAAFGALGGAAAGMALVRVVAAFVPIPFRLDASLVLAAMALGCAIIFATIVIPARAAVRSANLRGLLHVA